MYWRSVRLRCPECGRGRLFRGWFRMAEECSHCKLSYQREPGFYLGSIYINYGLTSAIVAVAYPLLRLFTRIDNVVLMSSTVAFAVIFPVVFFRHARSIWLGFDQFCDPKPSNLQQESGESQPDS